jgi:hypothetical protein
MKLGKRENLLLVLLVVFGSLLVMKSLSEGFKLTEDVSQGEKQFYEWVIEKQAESYDGKLYESGIFSIKVISISERTQEGKVYYIAKSRKYVLKVIPFSDVFIKEEKDKFN